LHRNEWFQRFAVSQLTSLDDSPRKLFSFSYTARLAIESVRARDWTTIVDQIDPGPEEERIVAKEHERYSHVNSRWRPAPGTYWDDWREEMELCDRIVVNSPWTAECLRGESIAPDKIDTIPLVYVPTPSVSGLHASPGSTTGDHPTGGTREEPKMNHKNVSKPIRILFLGQINLRKGIGRLIDAMHLLADESRFELTLAGPSEVDTEFWASLPNVHFAGPLRRSEVMEAYRAADVFILPTLSDGYALTQLEALSYGLPVIASRHCGPAVEDGVNGLILPDLEPETIAATIVRFAESEWSTGHIVAPAFNLSDLSQRLLTTAN